MSIYVPEVSIFQSLSQLGYNSQLVHSEAISFSLDQLAPAWRHLRRNLLVVV